MLLSTAGASSGERYVCFMQKTEQVLEAQMKTVNRRRFSRTIRSSYRSTFESKSKSIFETYKAIIQGKRTGPRFCQKLCDNIYRRICTISRSADFPFYGSVLRILTSSSTTIPYLNTTGANRVELFLYKSNSSIIITCEIMATSPFELYLGDGSAVAKWKYSKKIKYCAPVFF